MRIRTILLTLGVCCFLTGKADIKWLENSYDFGSFKEIAGPRTGSVRFVNTGDAPTIINRVRTSCGCTDSSYTEGLIAPGDTATVSFTYDPAGRPGRFEKTVKVYVGKEEKPKVIHISGTVIGRPESLQKWYPVEVGPLRLSEKILTTGEMTYGQSRHIFLQGYNQSPDTIYPSWKHNSPGISMSISDKRVAPGDGVTMGIYFSSKNEPGPGRITYPIEITADSRKPDSEKITIEFIAEVKPDLKGVTGADISKAPLLNIAPASIDLGKVKGNKPLQFKLTLTNIGMSTLDIKRIYSRDDRVRIKRWPMRLSPRKKGDCEGIILIGDFQPGPFRIRIETVSNDPLNPIVGTDITGIKQ